MLEAGRDTLCFFIPGWREADRIRIAHSLFEIGVRLGLRFTIVSRPDRLPSGIKLVTYAANGTGDDSLPCAWGGRRGKLVFSGKPIWAAKTQIGDPDLVAGIADLLHGCHERGLPSEAYEQLGRIKPGHHPLARQHALTMPLVEHGVELFRERLEQTGVSVPPISGAWPKNAQRAIVLSHDVDGPRLQSMRSILRYAAYGFILGAPDGRESCFYGFLTRMFGRPDPQWTFEQWCMLEKTYGIRSTFFVYPGSTAAGRHRLDPDYDPAEPKLTAALQALAAHGMEIGVHYGLKVRTGPEHRDSLARLQELVRGTVVTGARAHYWGRDWRNPLSTWQALDDAGYCYDASANPCALGFRFGTSLPFMPSFIWRGGATEGLVVLPTAMMDSYTVKRTSQMTADDLEAALADVETATGGDGGLLVLDWHERALANLGTWKGFMAPLLERLNRWRLDGSIVFLTAAEAATYWRAHARRCYLPLENFPALRS
jgi:hypothetical protein